MRGDRLGQVFELGDHGALVQAALIGLRRRGAHEKAPARGLDRRAGELRVGGDLVGVLDRAVTDYPVRLGHEFPPMLKLSSLTPEALPGLFLLGEDPGDARTLEAGKDELRSEEHTSELQSRLHLV